MAHSSFEQIFASLAQFDLLQIRLRHDLQHLQTEYEGLLVTLSHHRQVDTGNETSDLGYDARRLTNSGIICQPSSAFERPFQALSWHQNGASEDFRVDTFDTGKLDVSDTPESPSAKQRTQLSFMPDDEQRVSCVSSTLTTCASRLMSRSTTLTRVKSHHGVGDPNFKPLDLWPVWTEYFDEDAPILLSPTSSKRSKPWQAKPNRGTRRISVRAGDEIRGGGWVDLIVMRPSSRRRILWDILSIILLGYDVLMLPLEPFDLPETDYVRIMNMVILVFWSLDVLLSFTTGFHTPLGVLEMRLGMIAIRYVRTWFLLDVTVVIIDFLLLVVQTDGAIDFLSFARIGKSLRIIRVLRMFRLLRLVKAWSILGDLTDTIFSETTATAFKVFKLIIGIVLVNHFLACGWYAVGVHTFDDDADTWVRKLQAIETTETSLAWFYTSALHWSITQFTPASMEIVPCNVYERCYAIIVILLALVAFSSFISSITASMTHLRSINLENARQQNLIRLYVMQNKVSLDLGNRIQVFCRQSRSSDRQKTRVHEQDIPTFNSLPDSLSRELHGQVFVPIVDSHPFFFLLYHCDESGVLEICHNAMVEQSFSHGQTVFQTNDSCDSMLFILSGRFEYFHLLEAMPSSHLVNPEHVGETGLWIVWDHQGRLIAGANCEVARLDSQKFRAVAQMMEAFDSCKKYAKAYAEAIWNNVDEHMPSDTFKVPPTVAEKAFDQILENLHQEPETGVLSSIKRFVLTRSMSSSTSRLSIGSLSTDGSLDNRS